MTHSAGEDLAELPGAELVLVGLADLAAGRSTTEALLIEIAAPRLQRLGLAVPACDDPEPERTLYLKLFAEQPLGVHGRYNALIRRLISFSQALEGRVARARRRVTSVIQDPEAGSLPPSSRSLRLPLQSPTGSRPLGHAR